MDNLRTSLQVLFQQIDGHEVLLTLQRQSKRRLYVDQKVDMELFTRHFRECDHGYTLEQIEEIWRLLDSNWMLFPYASGSRQHSPSGARTIFRSLLVFAQQTLTINSSEPRCRYEHLLRWNELASLLGEDILTTAFLAHNDLQTGCQRTSFTWPAILRHDNHLLTRRLTTHPLAELHFHLNGSTQLFTLNWLSLMNDISNRSKAFHQLELYQSPRYVLHDTHHENSLYLAAIKACAIRYLLFMHLHDDSAEKVCHDDSDEELVMRILNSSTTQLAYPLLPELERRIRSYGYCYAHHYGPDVVDYTISHTLTNDHISATWADEERDNELAYKQTIIAGERAWMYQTFRRIFSGNYTDTIYPSLFYVYLLFKGRIREEFVQLNNRAGFYNFDRYERRKTLFIRPNTVYDRLVPNLAISHFLLGGEQRYLEVRIAPKDSTAALIYKLHWNNQAVADMHFIPRVPSVHDMLNCPKHPRRPWNYNYIIHFIKQQDSQRGHNHPILQQITPRHHCQRLRYRKQAMSIAHLWRSHDPVAEDLSAIDAANAERLCRPEVFGQIFRYLRACHPDTGYPHLFTHHRHQLGITYHVGEDFLDIVDGLRAIDEARIFLDLQRHDRLGHALALGVDVEHYYQRNHRRVVMPKPLFLDNIVWLYFKAAHYQLEETALLQHRLQLWFNQLIEEVYPVAHIKHNEAAPHNPHDTGPYTMYQYYLAWLLRGDAPELYRTPHLDAEAPSLQTPWEREARCHHAPMQYQLHEARLNQAARTLYHRYHFDPAVKQMDEISEEFTLDECFIRAVKKVQQYLLEEVLHCGLCIETNPTSNRRIHKMARYIDHPILRFYNQGLQLPHKKCALPISLNTDDAGVFDTSLEREYALMACALEKWADKELPALSAQEIYDWLANIQDRAFAQAFKRSTP